MERLDRAITKLDIAWVVSGPLPDARVRLAAARDLLADARRGAASAASAARGAREAVARARQAAAGYPAAEEAVDAALLALETSADGDAAARPPSAPGAGPETGGAR